MNGNPYRSSQTNNNVNLSHTSSGWASLRGISDNFSTTNLSNAPPLTPLQSSSTNSPGGRSGFGTFLDRIRPQQRRNNGTGLFGGQQQQPDVITGSMSWTQRMTMFGLFLVGAAACFLISFMSLPLIVLKPGKFATMFTIGSLLTFFRYITM